jgi:hypothetical protein
MLFDIQMWLNHRSVLFKLFWFTAAYMTEDIGSTLNQLKMTICDTLSGTTLKEAVISVFGGTS